MLAAGTWRSERRARGWRPARRTSRADRGRSTARPSFPGGPHLRDRFDHTVAGAAARDLNDAQREAVTSRTGPLAIIAGAGLGQDAGHQPSGGVRDRDRRRRSRTRSCSSPSPTRPRREMVERMAALGHPGVTARRSTPTPCQLRHFWPAATTARRCRDPRLELPFGSCRSRAGCPGTTASRRPKDLADAIGWAKSRGGSTPDRGGRAEGGDRAPIPADLFARVYADYERAKARTGRDRLRGHARRDGRPARDGRRRGGRACASRKTWFSVDEYQDTNPLAERLLELWLGESRDLARRRRPGPDDLHVHRRDPEFLTRFERRHPGARVVALVENYRSTPAGAGARQPAPGRRPGGRARSLGRRARVAARRRSGGTPHEAARADRDRRRDPRAARGGDRAARDRDPRADERPAARARGGAARAPASPFRVRGQRFFDRREVRDARRLLVASGEPDVTGTAADRARPDAFEPATRLERGAAPARAGRRHASARRRSSCSCGWSRTLSGRRTGVDDRRRHRRARSARGRGGVRLRRRRQPPDLPPRQGPRVGRGRSCPRSRRASCRSARPRRPPHRRGAAAPVRRDHPRPPAPRAVVGGAPGRHGGRKAGARKPSRFLEALEAGAGALDAACGATGDSSGVAPRIRPSSRSTAPAMATTRTTRPARGAPALAPRPGPHGRRPCVRRRPRLDAVRDRRGPPAIDHGASPA